MIAEREAHRLKQSEQRDKNIADRYRMAEEQNKQDEIRRIEKEQQFFKYDTMD